MRTVSGAYLRERRDTVELPVFTIDCLFPSNGMRSQTHGGKSSVRDYEEQAGVRCHFPPTSGLVKTGRFQNSVRVQMGNGPEGALLLTSFQMTAACSGLWESKGRFCAWQRVA